MRFAPLFTLAVPVLLACHLPSADAPTSRTRASHEITAAEIERSGARTAWDAVRLLSGNLRVHDRGERGGPAFTSSRGRSSILLDSEPTFVLDGVRLVETGLLNDIAAGAILHIRLLTGPDATTRWGTNSGNGVVEITTRDSERKVESGL